MKITLRPLCSCFRSLDPDVTMRLIQFAHPVQRFLMPTWDLHLVILSSLQSLFMFETDNIIPLMTDTHSNISTAFGLHHEMLHHMTCMYLVWMSLQQRVFFKLSLIYCLNCVFLWRFSGLHKNHSGFEFPVLSTWIWINWNECFFWFSSRNFTSQIQLEFERAFNRCSFNEMMPFVASFGLIKVDSWSGLHVQCLSWLRF